MENLGFHSCTTSWELGWALIYTESFYFIFIISYVCFSFLFSTYFLFFWSIYFSLFMSHVEIFMFSFFIHVLFLFGAQLS